MTLSCLRKNGLEALSHRWQAATANPLTQLSQQRSLLGLALTTQADVSIQRQLLIQGIKTELQLQHLCRLFWQSFEARKQCQPSNSVQPAQTESGLLNSMQTLKQKIGYISHAIAPSWLLGESSHNLGAMQSSLHECGAHQLRGNESQGGANECVDQADTISQRLSSAGFGSLAGMYHTSARLSFQTDMDMPLRGQSAPKYSPLPSTLELQVQRKMGRFQDVIHTLDPEKEYQPTYMRFEAQPEVDAGEFWREEGNMAGLGASHTESYGQFSGGQRGQDDAPRQASTDQRHSHLINSEGWLPVKEALRALPQAQDVYEAMGICSLVRDIDVAFASFALFHFARLVGVKRSEEERQVKGEDGKVTTQRDFQRSALFYDRQELKRSSIFQRILLEAVKQRENATTNVLNSIVWSFTALRVAGHSERTPIFVKMIAEEIAVRAEQGAFESMLPHQVCKAAFGLSQSMRSDAPWDNILSAMCDSFMQSHEEIVAGPASSMLKCIATYRVVYGEHPVSEEFLQFLADSLLNPDPYSPGPQAISQGLWAMAKLGFQPAPHTLKSLATDVLYQIDKGNPVHRQAAANVFWSLAELEFPMSNTYFRQIMQTVMAHAYHFLQVHFKQVFHALRKYGYHLTVEQAETFGKCIIVCVPVHPQVSEVSRWRRLIDDLDYIVEDLQASGQEVPEALTQAIICLQNVTTQPRITMRKRRNIIEKVFHGHKPKKVPVHDLEKQHRERDERRKAMADHRRAADKKRRNWVASKHVTQPSREERKQATQRTALTIDAGNSKHI